jgi:hypothetical protein
MDHAAPAIFVALESSSLGAAIRQSTWIYMAANVGHIVALVCLAGAVAIMDLRMAGALAATAPGRVLRGARIGATFAFLGLFLTGSVLFIAEASHVILNPAFQLKLGLILLAFINAAVFEFAVAPKVRSLPALTPLPARARAAGVMSITLWVAVAICGRSIAYF